MTLVAMLRRRGQNTVWRPISLHGGALRTMWGVVLVLLALHMSVWAVGAHVVGTIGMQSSVRMSKDGRRIRYWREGTPHVVLELWMHCRPGVGASWPVRLRRKRARRREGMAAISAW